MNNISKKIVEKIQQLTGVSELKLAKIARISPSALRGIRYRNSELRADRAFKLLKVLYGVDRKATLEILKELIAAAEIKK